jgi:pimeloyl-ACP methyl ester carboxylesterase
MRYDDRGTASSKGNFQSATSADFASDVEAGIEYLKTRKEINKASIGLIGHSEGGLIAPLVASNSKDVAFIVLLAGPSIPGDQILLLQQELIGRATGVSEQDIAKSKKDNEACFSMIKKANDQSKVKAELIQYITQMLENDPNPKIPAGMTKETFMETQVSQLTSPWMQFFLTYDPQPALSKVKCPVLALNGEKDLQVPPKENLSAIKAALKKAKNKNVTIKELPGLNHLFQESNTGAPSEYAEIEQTFSPIALVEILNWVNRIVK